jgi:hypothetical protein
MIIVCSGPDTYSARQKARELGEAFKQKFDPSGYSTEVMTGPDVKELMNRMSAPSFFATKRFIRCDGLFTKIKIADVRALAKRVDADGDTTIVVTVEEEAPSEKHTVEFEKGRLVSYSYPLLQGAKFLAWCMDRAKVLGALESDAKEIAQHTDGDAWLAEQELMKRSANPHAELVEVAGEPAGTFEAADSFLTERTGWRTIIAEADEAFPMLAGQARSATRVADYATNGLHPFVAKKLSQLRIASPARRLMRAISALVAQRSGLAQTDEPQTLL